MWENISNEASPNNTYACAYRRTPHVCPECGKSFALKHCLSTHLLLHTSDRPYKCHECNKTFTLKHHLVSHERVHSRERPFECPECGQRFPQKRHLTTHIKFHSGERPFVCQVCEESFSREEHLVMHSRFHGGQRPFICPDCGAGFLRKFELVNHERQHGRNPESCPVCGKEFLQKRTLLVHVRTCGTSLQMPSQSLSPQRFSNNESTSLSPNKTCKECGETFASVEGLALHMRLHFGDHSFLSDICSLAASLKQSAVNAALTLSLASKKTHVCTDCGRGFTQKHGLFTHKQRHENGSCKLKQFACDKCGKCFAQKNHLSLHERQHMDLNNQRNSLNTSTLQQNQVSKDDPNEQSNLERSNQEHEELDQEPENRLMEQNQSIRMVLNSERTNSVMQAQSQSEHAPRHNSLLQRCEEDRHRRPHESLNHQSEEGLVNRRPLLKPILHMDLQPCSSGNDSLVQEDEMEQHDQPVERYLDQHRQNNEGQHSVTLIRHQNSSERIHSCESLNPPTRSIGEQHRPIPLALVRAPVDNRISINLARQSNHSEQDLLNHQHHVNPSPPLETPPGSAPSFQHASNSKHQF